jgi:IstB-like ATP binding protein
MSTPTDSSLDRVRRHLVGLKMPRALETLHETLARIERGELSTLEAIEALLGEELTTRQSRRIKMALQTARLTTIKTLAGYDFSFQPSLGYNGFVLAFELPCEKFADDLPATRVRLDIAMVGRSNGRYLLWTRPSVNQTHGMVIRDNGIVFGKQHQSRCLGQAGHRSGV